MRKKHYLCTQIVLWCNGSTTVFGSVSGGSNPPGTTQKRRKILISFGAFCFSMFLVLPQNLFE